jgi:hypothetical protein
MTRSAEPTDPIPGAENLVTVMGGTGRPARRSDGEDLARHVPPRDDRPALDPLGGSLPPFAR